MTVPKYLTLLIVTLTLTSCIKTTYKLISKGSGTTQDVKYTIKNVLPPCCGCSGVLVNTFKSNKLQSQLFIESNEGCPYNWTKYYFYYSTEGTLFQIDTLIAVTDSSFKYPITDIDKIALIKVDSFMSIQNSSLYRLAKINITGYRDKKPSDSRSLRLLPPRLDRRALF